MESEPECGICFDVDGVIALGTVPLPPAQRAIRNLQNKNGDVFIPTCYVTNSLSFNQDKAKQLSDWLNVPISTQQVIQAQGPLEVFTEYHDKLCLVVGQEKIPEILQDLGFKNWCTLEQVNEAYPLLDMVNHANRKKVAHKGLDHHDVTFPRIEVILLLGEPKRWESYLQVLVDILLTNGKPDNPPEELPDHHLPVIACNFDLQFMDRACMPRYGHGAFLYCLETLYKKVSGKPLEYTSLTGKPSEITFRFAEHCLSRDAKRIGIDTPLKRMYIISDRVEVDIAGANLYQKYVRRLEQRRNANPDIPDQELEYDPTLPACRTIPKNGKFLPQSIEEVCSVLVCTGVYKKGVEPELEGEDQPYHGHRDFPYQKELYKPTWISDNVEDAILAILEKEKTFTNQSGEA